jgi:TP901 family phage tail tape measure protein
MSQQVKAITLRAKYESDLSGFQDDIAAIKSFRRQMEKLPVKIPVKLDLSSIRADALKAAAEIKKTVSSALAGGISPGSTTSKGGLFIPASAAAEMRKFAETSSGAFKQMRTDGDKVVKTFEQLERGAQRVTTVTKNKKNGGFKTSITEIDTTPLEKFRKELDKVERKFASELGRNSGNKGAQAKILQAKRDEIAAALNGKEFAAVRNTPAYQKADRSLDRLNQRIESLRSGQDRTDIKVNRGTRIDSLKEGLLGIEKATAADIGNAKGTRGDVAQVLANKKAQIEGELAKFADIKDSPAFRQAQKSLATLDKQIAQALPQQDRAADKEKTASRIRSLQDSLLGIDTASASKIGNAKGTGGDVAQVLADKRERIARELANFGDVADSAAFKQAQKAINTLDKQIAQALPQQQKAASKEAKASRVDSLKNALLNIEQATGGAIGAAKGSGGDVAQALNKRRMAIFDELSKFSDVADSPAFKGAQKKVSDLTRQISQADEQQRKASQKNATRSATDQFKEALLQIDKATAATLGNTKGTRGDVAAVLADKRNRIEAELAKYTSLQGSSAYRQAQKTIASLDQQIAKGVPEQAERSRKIDERTRKQRAQDFTKRSETFIDRQRNTLNRNLEKQAKAEIATAKLIDDRGAREREVNRILDQREAMMERQIRQFREMQTISKSKGFGAASNKYRMAANGLDGQLNQLRLDRTRSEASDSRDDSNNAIKRRISDIEREYKARSEILKNEEALARKTSDRTARERELQAILAKRQALQRATVSALSPIRDNANLSGREKIFTKAQSLIGSVEKSGISDMRRLAVETRNSGHALNFHTSSLIQNAATFTKWYVPAQGAMMAFAALSRGATQAVQAQRTFKILNAVYQGSAEDAARLARETLELAAANGRSVEEAAQAAVAWSRLGLSRTQILVAMETSLRAANVAEISAAEATAYLTANYRAFGQTIAEIPATLDFINALSNKNAAAPKEIFEGLSRSGNIAKQAGIEFQTLASIIATGIAVTQRPGAEFGNAVKTIITRLSRETTQKGLKLDFGIDLRDAGGQVKNMTQILSELAAAYPNISEKGMFKDLVAGANQGNRFAVLMENWTEVLIAQGKAGLDANSAMRENEQIISSVSSKLQGLDTEWTQLFTTLGEFGIFDAVSGALTGVRENIEAVGDAVDWLDQKMGGRDDSGFNPYSIGNMSGRFASSGFNPLTMGLGIGKDILSGEFNKEKKPSSLAVGEIGRMANKSVQSQNAILAMDSGQQAFTNMALQFGNKNIPNTKILKQFDEAISFMSELPGGASNVAKARLSIRPLLEGGKTQESKAALAKVAEDLKKGSAARMETAEPERLRMIDEAKTIIAQTAGEADRLNKELADTTSEKKQKRLNAELSDTEKLLRGQQDALATLQKTMAKQSVDPIAEYRESITAYLNDLKLVGKVYGDLLTSMGSTGFTTLDSKLKIGAARLEGNLLEDTISKTNTENARLNTTDESLINSAREFMGEEEASRFIALKEMEIQARNATAQAMQTELDKLREATAEQERQLELERQAATLRAAYDESRASTASGLSAFEVGRSEGERIINRTRGAMSGLRADIGNPSLGAGDPDQDFREQGAIVEKTQQVKQGIVSIEDRLNRAIAERLNLELDIEDAKKRQTEEASRSLALASREDQLRSAAAAALLKSQGRSQFSLQEFQFFSQETRSAISGINPRTVKGLDSTETDEGESRRKLDQEIEQLSISLRKMREEFAGLLPKAEEKAAGIVDGRNPFNGKTRTGSEITGKDLNEIRMNLNAGPIHIDIDIGKHLQPLKDMLQVSFDAKLSATADGLRRLILGTKGPDTAPAAGAF